MKTKEINKFRSTYQPYNKKCCFEGYKLAVLFDEKDEVKRLGGRWNANEQTWWMPHDRLQSTPEGQGGQYGFGDGETVHEWLNRHKMIMGPYGDFDYTSEAAKQFLLIVDDMACEEFQLTKDKVGSMRCRVYLHLDITHVFESTGNSGKYMHREDGRIRWEELVKEGYNRTINA
tara:strand:- start:8 stop:529 length:522 start_codon:yes stop_codon:yes gene_type:complete